MAKKANEVNENSNMSKSKAKREAQRKEAAKIRQQRMVSKVVSSVILAVIALLILFAVGKQIYILAIRTTPSTDYSAGLSADGKIENTNVLSSLALVDYENISIPEDEVNATDEEVDAEIDSALEAYKELSTDETLEIADGDEVNIDYVGTIDGVEFEGGNSEGAGYDLTIGSGSFIDDFEEQLIGHKPGEEVTVEVTFPDDYGDDEVAGKDAVFAVTINGIMKAPELTDEFVEVNLADSEGVSTASEYRVKIENDFYEEHLEEYLKDYIVENSTVNSYPKKYLKCMKALLKNSDNMGSDIEDEIEYEKELTQRAQESVKEAMVYQAIAESEGLTFDMAAYTEENGEEYVESLKESYGEGYIAQSEVRQMVVDYLMDLYR